MIVSAFKAARVMYPVTVQWLPPTQKVEWWQHHAEKLPNWSSAVKKVLLVQPSSAAAERVFSILNASFNDQQDHALADYLQATVMLQYNKR